MEVSMANIMNNNQGSSMPGSGSNQGNSAGVTQNPNQNNIHSENTGNAGNQRNETSGYAMGGGENPNDPDYEKNRPYATQQNL